METVPPTHQSNTVNTASGQINIFQEETKQLEVSTKYIYINMRVRIVNGILE